MILRELCQIESLLLLLLLSSILLLLLLLLLLSFPVVDNVYRRTLTQIRVQRIFVRFILTFCDVKIFQSMDLTEFCFFNDRFC